MAVAAPVVYTVTDGLARCNIDNANNPNNLGSDAARLSEAIFGDLFTMARDINDEQLEMDLKTFSDLAQDAIILMAIQKRTLRAFIQWVKDKLRQDEDPTTIEFPNDNDTIIMLIRRTKTHELFMKKSEAMIKSAKPALFTEEMLWSDWYPTLLNFLRHIPGRDGVPLKYVCRANGPPLRTPHPNFLDDYVLQAPLTGEAFDSDAAEVHTWISSLVVGNNTAESKISPYETLNNGHIDFMALKEHYEGVGVLAITITKAEHTLKNLFYSGEKKPHMWWEEFERRLQEAFIAYNKKENRVVHSNEMKLRLLMDKVNADFLAQIRASLTVEISKIPMLLTYEEAMASFRSEVNRKFPPQVGSNTRTRRSVQATQSMPTPAGRGRGRGFSRGGRGSPGRGQGRGGRGQVRLTRNDSTIITLTDGKQIEYHPSFNFPPNIYRKMRQQDIDRLKRDRAEYKARRMQPRQTQGVYPLYPQGNVPPPPPYLNPQQQGIATTTTTQHYQAHPNAYYHPMFNNAVPTTISASNSTTAVSQMSEATRQTGGGHTMMGGRNEQANMRRGY